MEYAEITVTTNTAGAEAVSEMFMRMGAAGTQIFDRADLPDVNAPTKMWELMDQSVVDAMPEEVEVKAWFPRDEKLSDLLLSMRETLRGMTGFGALSLSQKGVREEDWSETWKQYYKPFRIGERLVVKPTWETWDERPGDLMISLDPGMAFGTGTHETTAMCVELIEKYYAGGKMLDVGTGSGILAIAAGKLGARGIVAVDIDPDAVRVARENVELNGMSDRIDVREGDLTKGLNERFDFAVANILAPVICMLAAPLKNHLLPGALFVCSGIIAEAEDDVRSALADAGYQLIERRVRGDWVALAARV